MDTIPNELLCAIFEQCALNDTSPSRLLFGDNMACQAITLVSRRWEKAALAVPNLWTTVTSRLTHSGVLRWLNLSHDLPVRVVLNVPNHTPQTGDIVNHVFAPCASRMQALFVLGRLELLLLWPAVRQAHTPHLSYLHFMASNNVYDLDPKTFHAPFLQRPLERLFMPLSLSLRAPITRNIDVLDLEISRGSPEVIHSLQYFRNLTVVRLNWHDKPLHTDFQPVVLDRLERLYLFCGALHQCNILRHLTSPALRVCGITTFWREVDGEDNSEDNSEDGRMLKLAHAIPVYVTRKPQSLFLWVDSVSPLVLLLALPSSIDWTSGPDALEKFREAISSAVLAMCIYCDKEMSLSTIAESIISRLVASGVLSSLEEFCLFHPEDDFRLPSYLNLFTALRGLDTVHTAAIHCSTEIINSLVSSWLTKQPTPETSTSPGNTPKSSLEESVKKLCAAWNAERDMPDTTRSESLFTDNTVQTIKDMDFRPALWGRKRGEPLPAW